MKICEMRIYGYGKLENIHFQNMGQLAVFFGENEAGKSTVMSFIHSMLFGFPTKVQSERRYEPKNHAKYGGMMVLETKRQGRVQIERVKGKAAGDVTVTLENGEIGAEDLLNDLLQYVDKSYYQSIFSFNLDGLQGLSNMSEDKIGTYLLSAGLLGSSNILDAESSLQKELDQRFKPSGQKPRLNVGIKQLKESQQQMNFAYEEQNAYTHLLDQQKQIVGELINLNEQLRSVDEQLYFGQEFLRIKPLAEEQELVQKQLLSLGELTFPTDGIKRLEQILPYKIQLDASLASLEEKYQEQLKVRDHLHVSPYIEKNKEKIEAVIENSYLLENLELEKVTLEQEINRCDKQINEMKRDLSFQGEESEILRLKTDAFAKEKVQHLEQEKSKLRHLKVQLDERYKTESNNLEVVEQRIKELKQRKLPPQQRKKLEEAMDRRKNENYLDVKKALLDEQIEELTKKTVEYKKKAGKSKKLKRIVTITAVLLFVGLAMYMMNEQPVLAVILLAVAAVIGAVGTFLKGEDISSELDRQLAEAKRKKTELEKQTNDDHQLADNSAGQLLEKDRELEKLLINETYKFEEREHSFHAIITEFEKWEAASKKVETDIHTFINMYHLPTEAAQSNISSVFERLEKLKTACIEKNEKIEKLKFISKEVDLRKTRLFHYAMESGSSSANWREALSYLKKVLNDQRENEMIAKQQLDEEKKTTADINRIRTEKSYVAEQLTQLFKLASADNEEEFRYFASLAEEKSQLQSRSNLLAVQLEQSSIKQNELPAYFEKNITRYYLDTLEKNRIELTKKQTKCLEKQSDLKHQVRQLEEGGIYEEKMHQFYEMRATFNEEAKEWAKYALAKELLNKTIHTFKTERLPQVLAKAEEYFSYLTDGEYTKIIIKKDEDGFFVQQTGHLLFHVNEISRGTAEQLYVSFRLALADTAFADDPFPLIIDDSFVNFDKKRTRNIMNLLQRISENRQIIFFTCHEHLLSYFSKRYVNEWAKPEQNKSSQSLTLL